MTEAARSAIDRAAFAIAITLAGSGLIGLTSHVLDSRDRLTSAEGEIRTLKDDRDQLRASDAERAAQARETDRRLTSLEATQKTTLEEVRRVGGKLDTLIERELAR